MSDDDNRESIRAELNKCADVLENPALLGIETLNLACDLIRKAISAGWLPGYLLPGYFVGDLNAEQFTVERFRKLVTFNFFGTSDYGRAIRLVSGMLPTGSGLKDSKRRKSPHEYRQLLTRYAQLCKESGKQMTQSQFAQFANCHKSRITVQMKDETFRRLWEGACRMLETPREVDKVQPVGRLRDRAGNKLHQN
jgi:hypothetical protein